MNRTLYFGTSSDVKFAQYEKLFSHHGVTLLQGPVVSTLIEPQFAQDEHTNYEILVSHPLRLASRFLSSRSLTPYMVEDTVLVISRFSDPSRKIGGLPGADTKNWWLNLGESGVLNLLADSRDRSATFTSVIGIYCGPGAYYFCETTVSGKIARKPRSSHSAFHDIPVSNPFFFHSIFIPDGTNSTYAEMPGHLFEQYDYRRKNVVKLIGMVPADVWAERRQGRLEI